MTAKYVLLPFRRWHLDVLGISAEGGEAFDHTSEDAHLMEKSGLCWTLVYGADPVACGGFFNVWKGRYIAWMLLNEKSGRHMVAVTRHAVERMARLKGRIELTVRADFAKGHRWAKLLGFEVEAPVLRRFGHDGADHVGYAKVNGE